MLMLLLFLSPLQATAAQSASTPPGIYGDVALDFFVPGYGAFTRREYVTGSLLAVGRLGTLYAAGAFYVQFREYQSAERAARTAGLFFGPGLRYKDPYSSGYATADDFRDRAERRAFFAGTAVTVHAVLTIVSLWWTADHAYARHEETLPVFPEPGANARAWQFDVHDEVASDPLVHRSNGWRVDVRWRGAL